MIKDLFDLLIKENIILEIIPCYGFIELRVKKWCGILYGINYKIGQNEYDQLINQNEVVYKIVKDLIKKLNLQIKEEK